MSIAGAVVPVSESEVASKSFEGFRYHFSLSDAAVMRTTKQLGFRSLHKIWWCWSRGPCSLPRNARPLDRVDVMGLERAAK